MKADEELQRERPAWILGIGLGLGVIVASVLVLVLVRARPVDAALALEGSFELGELPFGLRLGAAVRLPSGETVVVLSDGHEELMGVQEAIAAPDDQDDAQAAGESIDWSALEELEAGRPPTLFYLVRYTESQAERAISRGFRGTRWKELSELDAGGGRIAVEGGKLAWGPFEADFVRERRFRPEPSFRDSIRVNLALSGRYWIGYAFWPESHPASTERLEELLAALLPVSEEG